MEKINICSLIPTHNKLRSLDALNLFRDKLRNNPNYGFGEIRLIKTEKDQLFIWDGHHKLVAHYLEGYMELRKDIFVILPKHTLDVKSINFQANFITPFDIEEECRLPEFFFWKQDVFETFKYFGYEAALGRIVLQSHMYKEKRTVNSLMDLGELYRGS